MSNFKYIKNKYEINKMRIAGKIAAQVLEMIKYYIRPGISTNQLNNLCHDYIVNKHKATCATLNYYGFPKSICVSINEVVCHGIPNDREKLKNGDILNIDVAIIKDGFYSDTSKMFIVGKASNISKKLCNVAKQSLYLAIKMVKPGINLNKLGKVIQKFVESNNFSVVRDYCGHGIGKNFHEPPQVLHYENSDYNCILQPGMIFTIEPMINIGGHDVYVTNDGWTVKTKDSSLSAQYEHTLLVTNNGCEILTLRSDDNIPKIINHCPY
ncbi:MAG: type I methionyl aminopeptidase [Candidatus Lightella neohaematopini]|nr:type I methionyl aminopeptidase [Candidatus Lightella neohaematopini]